MSELLVILAVLLGGVIAVGCVVLGVWLGHVSQNGFPKFKWPQRSPVVRVGVPPSPPPEEPVSFRPPPGPLPGRPTRHSTANSLPVDRDPYGGGTDEERVAAFEKMQAELEVMERLGPNGLAQFDGQIPR